MKRRQFLLGGLALAATASLAIPGWHYFSSDSADNRQQVLSVLFPALLYSALPAEPVLAQAEIKRSCEAVTEFICYLPLRQQQELTQLFDILANRLGQLALTGHITALPELTIGQRLELLNRWRDSYLAVLQQAYHGLRELLYGAYYGQPEHWQPLAYTAPRFR